MRKNTRKIIRQVLASLHILMIIRRLRRNSLAGKAIVCKLRYAKRLKEIRAKSSSEKIRVLFVVSEISKWKEQRLYEEMESSDMFEPIIGLSAWNSQSWYPPAQLKEIHDRAEKFFHRLGDHRIVRTVHVEKDRKVFHDLSEFKPDVVFYTEHWGPCEKQDPYTVSKFALTFHVPYYTPNYGRLEWDCQLPLHVQLFVYFCLNEKWQKLFERSLSCVVHSVRFVPAGHPALDFFNGAVSIPPGDSVIFAPHFSIPHPMRADTDQFFSTFDWSGRIILEYAQKHPQFNWVFKPHPLLRAVLKSTKIMTDDEIEEYYAAWGRIGRVCEDGDYQQLFLDSRVMITDCGSFLTEYGATGRPVIRLICAQNTMTPCSLTKQAYDTYYPVHNPEELRHVFAQVLETREDPLRAKRLAAIATAGFTQSNASKAIVDYMSKLFGRAQK